MKEEAPDIDYGIAAIPQDAAQATYGVTDSIVMFADSEVKDEAWKFLSETAFTDKWRADFTQKEGFLPVFKAVAEERSLRRRSGAEGVHRHAAFRQVRPIDRQLAGNR